MANNSDTDLQHALYSTGLLLIIVKKNFYPQWGLNCQNLLHMPQQWYEQDHYTTLVELESK